MPTSDQGIARAHEVTPDDRKAPYLVKLPGGSIWYVATANGFAAADERLVGNELKRHWPNLPTRRADGKLMQPVELFDKYGIRAENLYYSYTSATRFAYRDPHHTGDLYIQCGLEPAPDAVEHRDVLDWLANLCDDDTNEDRLLDWLATVPRLDRPTCAIVLLGPPSAGKSMFALGVSRYFGQAIVKYDDVFTRFNAALLSGPVVWLDEGTEVDARSTAFRSLLANDAHAVEAKHRPTATLLGCPRLIVASNNPDPLRLGREDLTAEDERAIGERILTIDCSPLAVEWLAERGHYKVTHDWVKRADGSPGKIPETIAWLAANREVDTAHRFLVSGNAADWASRIATRTGLPATILEAIAFYEAQPSTSELRQDIAKIRPQPLTHETDTDLWLVSPKGLRAAWRKLCPDEPVPTDTALGNALGRLGSKRRPTVNDKRTCVYAVPRALVTQ